MRKKIAIKGKNAAIKRRLLIYHILRWCETAEMNDFYHFFRVNREKLSEKTIQRDIDLLRSSGIRIDYLKDQKAYQLYGYQQEQNPSVGKIARQIHEKINRLTRMMSEMGEADDPLIWYHETFPDVSKRTRERDFATLNSIGYYIVYELPKDYRNNEHYQDCIEDGYRYDTANDPDYIEPYRYYCSFPADYHYFDNTRHLDENRERKEKMFDWNKVLWDDE